MPSPVNPPDAPPAAPTIPEGLATKVGKYGALAFLALGVLLYVFDIEFDLEEALMAGLAAVTLWTMMWGRFQQAVAIYTPAPAPGQDVVDPAFDFDENDFPLPEEEVPSDEDLKEHYSAPKPPQSPEHDDPVVPPGLDPRRKR